MHAAHAVAAVDGVIKSPGVQSFEMPSYTRVRHPAVRAQNPQKHGDETLHSCVTLKLKSVGQVMPEEAAAQLLAKAIALCAARGGLQEVMGNGN